MKTIFSLLRISRQLFFCSLAGLIVVVGAAPGLSEAQTRRFPSNISPGTRFGGIPQEEKLPIYQRPVDPEQRYQEQPESRQEEASPGESAADNAPEAEKPAPRKVHRRPKFIEVR